MKIFIPKLSKELFEAKIKIEQELKQGNFKVLSIIISLPPISNSIMTLPSVSPFLSKAEPFCPGCSPNNANSIPKRIEVFPEPMSPDNKVEPSENCISCCL